MSHNHWLQRFHVRRTPKDALPPSSSAKQSTEVQAFVQAPVAMVAMAALGAASTAVQSLVDVERAEGLAGPTGLF